LYVIYDEAMIRETTGNMEIRISVRGHINTVRYDGKAVVANSRRGLQQLMDNPNVTRELS